MIFKSDFFSGIFISPICQLNYYSHEILYIVKNLLLGSCPPPFFGGMYTVKSEVIIRKSTLKLKVKVSSNFLIVKIFLIRLPPFPNVSAKKFTTLVIILEVQI